MRVSDCVAGESYQITKVTQHCSGCGATGYVEELWATATDEWEPNQDGRYDRRFIYDEPQTPICEHDDGRSIWLGDDHSPYVTPLFNTRGIFGDLTVVVGPPIPEPVPVKRDDAERADEEAREVPPSIFSGG